MLISNSEHEVGDEIDCGIHGRPDDFRLTIRKVGAQEWTAYRNGFKGARKLPASAVEMNCPFARVDRYINNNIIVDCIWNIDMQEIRCIL